MKRIGQGTYGSVYLAKRKDGVGGYVVMKRVFVVEENSKQHKQAENEVKMLKVIKTLNFSLAFRDCDENVSCSP